MKRILAFLAAGFAGALLTLFAMSYAAAAFAQGPADPGPPFPGSGQMLSQAGGRGQMQNQGRMMGGAEQSLVGMAAAELNQSRAELIAQLGANGTIADTLTNGGVDPASFISSFVASRAERLDAAVAAGTISQEEAAARLATVQSMATARIYQPFTVLGPGGQGPNQSQGQGGQGNCDQANCTNFVDADGDGVCDQMPGDGNPQRGNRHGPNR
ncbi:MAG: hypothetical protein HC822_09995 [Oscillochloris sp.]|nr:hypothetical protein [Oscillochloris sp.]